MYYSLLATDKGTDIISPKLQNLFSMIQLTAYTYAFLHLALMDHTH